jgi:hypothetical protein
MRYAAVILLMLAFFASAQWAGTAPYGKNENNSLYITDAMDYDIYLDRVGSASYTTTVNGADTLFAWVDFSSATYDHTEMWWIFGATGDATDEDMIVKVYRNPSTAFSARTAADTVTLSNENSGGSGLGSVYYTVTPDSASYADKVLWGCILPGEVWETPEYWYDATSATDSTGFGVIIITNDSCEVFWQTIQIPRT